MFFIHAEVSSQVYSLSLRNTPIRNIIHSIEKQGDYRFFFSDDLVDLNRRVQIDISNATIEQLLDELLKPYDMDYQILENNMIIIKAHATVKQDFVVSGTVTDADGETLPGVNVVFKGIPYGTVTNPDGVYTIRVPDKNTVLSFSFVGYATCEVVVGNRTTINVTLEEDSYRIPEVVITALGIKRAEKALSYNMQEIKGDELIYVNNANFINSLSGKVAGVQINSGASGHGSAVKVVMRGAKSLSKNNNALYVIDGVPMYHSGSWNNTVNVGFYSTQPGTDAVTDLNPDDIESISLLTGPSAAALYGYEGANGVVLITTKKGDNNGTTISAGNSTIFSTPLMMPKFQNKYGNITGESESWGSETPYRYDPALFFNTGSNVSNSISISTGNEKSRTYFSMASVNTSGILPNNRYDRYNFTFRNTTSFLNNRLVLDIGANHITQKDKNMVSQGQYFTPLPALYLFPRGENFDEIRQYERYDDLSGIHTQFWPYGDQGLSLQNPYWIMYRMNRDSGRKRYRFSADLQYHINDWLNVTGRVHADNTDFRNTEKRFASTLATFAGSKGFFLLNSRREQQIYGDLIANANKYAGDFSFFVNLGASIKDLMMDNHDMMGNLNHITNWFTIENINRIQGFRMNEDGIRHQTQSLFANAETGYKNMIYLTLTGRNDWDSALSFSESGDKLFFYPSAGLSVLISEMIRMPQWISFMKARFSLTSVGTAYDVYMTKENYEYDEQTDQYHTSSLYPNRNLKPELTRSYEAGLNMQLFKGALYLDATWYKSNTLNQTFIANVPGSAYSGVYVQSGDVQNSGIELALGVNGKWGDFKWNSHLTYSMNNNVIKKLANGIKNPVTGETIHMPYLDKGTLGSSGSPEIRLVEGGSMGDIYVRREWKLDNNGILQIDENTLLPYLFDSDYKKAGSVMPKVYSGWKNTISCKGITLNFLINGRFGGVVVSNTQALLDRYGVSEYSAKMRDREIVVKNMSLPIRDYLNIVAAGTGQGAHYVYSATNLRLGELSIHYAIPKKWTGNFADITIGLVGVNLAMIYCKAPFDPELEASVTNSYYTGVDYFMHPGLRSVGVQVRVQF